MPYFINSHPDTPGQNNFTQLEINDALSGATFRYFVAGQRRYVLGADIGGLFLLRFSRFDLASRRMFWGYVEYRPQGKPAVAEYSEQAGKIVLVYQAAAEVVVPPRPPSQPPPPPQAVIFYPPPPPQEPPLPPGVADLSLPTKPENIRVTVTIEAAGNPARPSNHGWLNFDISHGFPREFESPGAAYAWEQTLHYPQFSFDPAAAAGFEPAITGPLQFSALYTKTDHADRLNHVSGIAVHVEDERGHHKFAWYDKKHASFNYTLRNSMHLSGQKFVRPEGYSLRGGDDYGFGGNRMMYRVRAFRVEGAAAGVPVGPHDVLDIYRRWLRARFEGDTASVFYDKILSIKARPHNAPADEMSPHTVITNYGLDGAVDPPDPPPPPGARHLSRWLEMHPIRNRPDIPGNENDSFLTLLGRLRARFPDPASVKLEVQAWGIEKAGFYQFICGFPPLTNLLSGNPQKFKQAVADMAAARVALSVTTDPLNALFNRGRYGGHLRWRGSDWSQIGDHTTWEPFIKQAFPLAFRDSTCPVSVTKVGGKQFNRLWIVEHFPPVERVPASEEAARLKACQRMNAYGELQQNLPVIGTGLYRGTQKQLCPVADNADVYLNRWVKPWLIGQGVRVVEFMKHGSGGYFCYRTDHQHVVEHPHVAPPPPGSPPVPPDLRAAYTNVIGYGSWHVRRLQCMLYDVHEAGKVFDADPLCSFRLIHEFTPAEALAPYVNQCYSTDENFIFVYSHLVTAHQSPARGWGAHPGYKEERRAPGPRLVRPEYMLHPQRDADPAPPALSRDMTPEQVNEVVRQRGPSFRRWRDECINYFNANFRVADYGVAPRSYPTGDKRPGEPAVPWNPQDPLAPTNPPTYTFNRCVQQVFNLRANIFATGERAVLGERIAIPAPWLEEPLDYDDEALAHAVRAARLQTGFKEFFRHGRMLGETRIVSVNGGPPKDVWAWNANSARTFDDVTPLVEHLTQDDPFLGGGWHARPLRDFVSKAWDKQFYPDKTFNDIVVQKQIQHRVWQHGEGDARRVLYAFANIGNTNAAVVFLYGRGLEGVTRETARRRVVQIIGPPAAPPPPAADVWPGARETGFVIPARSFAAVLVRKKQPGE